MLDTGKILVLTGASRGIGRATVARFLFEGWRVVTCARDDVPEAARGHPRWTDHIRADLSKPGESERFVEAALARIGDAPVHALVNNAGVSPKTPYKERLGCLNGAVATWRSVFELNLFAPLALARGFAPALARGKGAIVNLTSIAGRAVHPFAGSAYGASKAALSALTREMAAEFAALGVRVNAVRPGEIETGMIAPEYEGFVPRIPMRRLGTPEEVAGVIYRLCEGDFAYVTGAEIDVTGGQHVF